MTPTQRVRPARTERGSVILFVVALLGTALAFGGWAIDMSYWALVRKELLRTVEASSLAAAGNLWFDATVFPGVRSAAQTYGTLNPYSGGTVTLGANSGNADAGNIVLGIYNGTTGAFTPSTDGTLVNAVRCQTTVTIPTLFMGMVGLNTLSVSASAIAVSNPPANPPPDTAIAPIALPQCPFQSGGGFSSAGCGTVVSQTQFVWVNLVPGQSANANDIRQQVTDAFNGTTPGSTLKAGVSLNATNGNDQSVYDTLAADFATKFNVSPTYTIHDRNGNTAYAGKGWRLVVPIVPVPCAGSAAGTYAISTWSYFVITQVINHGDCAVANHYPGNVWDSKCAANGDGTIKKKSDAPAQRAVYGYYDCARIDSEGVTAPAPRTAVATRVKLVQ